MEANKSNWMLGLIVIALGIIALLNNFDITDISIGSLIADYWPLFLLAIGLNLIVDHQSRTGTLFGSFIIIIGAVFLGRNLGFLPVDLSWFWKALWPAILILLGLSLLTVPRSGGKANLAFLGAIEKKRNGWALEKGDYWAIMGGVELDLSSAQIPAGTTTLTLTAFWGGIKVIVPAEIAITCEGTAILGGLEFLGKGNGGIFASLKTEQGDPADSAQTIKILCHAIMGGVEIKAR